MTNTQAQAAVSKTNSAQTECEGSRAALKPFDVQHLRGLLEKATPRPWSNQDAGEDIVTDADVLGDIVACPPDALMSNEYWPHTRALIVDAINALPALLDRVEELEGRVETKQALLDTLTLDERAAFNQMTKANARAQAAEARAEKMDALLDKTFERLSDIAHWRERAVAHDEDMGHPIRTFDADEWENIEAAAMRAAKEIHDARQALSTGETK